MEVEAKTLALLREAVDLVVSVSARGGMTREERARARLIFPAA